MYAAKPKQSQIFYEAMEIIRHTRLTSRTEQANYL